MSFPFERLRRAPDIEGEGLVAADAADRLILDESAALRTAAGPGEIVVIGDGYGALALGAAFAGARDVRVHQDALSGERALAANAQALGLDDRVSSGALDAALVSGARVVLLRLPRALDALREAVRSSKGPGNFKNLFMYAPAGKKDGMQVIPLSEVAAKDEFFNIKNVTRDDLLAAHRVPPQLLGVVPSNTGGFGAVTPAAQVFVTNELQPLQQRFTEVNKWVGEEVVRFRPYVLEGQNNPD